jgi:hypothetical protein
MSENKHVAAIKRETYWIRSRYSGHQELAFRANQVDEHTDALAAQLAEAEARAGRLRAFAEDMAWYVPQQDWEETARQKLNYGDCRRYVEIMSDAGDLPDTDGDSE